MITHVEHVMGTAVSITVEPGPDDTEAIAAACAVLHDADATFSTFKDGSLLSRHRRGELRSDELPPDLLEVLELSARAARLTGGYFDPWAMPGGVDPTGLVKGWAAQRASDRLLAHGLRDHVVNAAGDLVVAGLPAPEAPDQPWRVGISDPADPGALLGHVELTTTAGRWAVATSGPAEQGQHVVDPRTGTLVAGVASASVLVREEPSRPQAGAWADACATALVAADGGAGLLLDRLCGLGVPGFVLDARGRLTDPGGLLRRS